MPLISGTRLGPYEIVAPIGAGGMGEVYRASDPRLGRTVAIKVLSSRLTASDELRRRFEREARTISQLSHPNICAIYDVGREGDLDYLVMEHLEGETLAARLARGPMAFGEALTYGREIATALVRAHRAGVVHRDLKPGNVMLTSSGSKLLDFGLARLMEPVSEEGAQLAETATGPLTAKGVVVGTLAYMAPELIEGKAADARSDVFAFGAVLYEMASNRRAFSGDSRASLLVSVLSADPPSLGSLVPGLPRPYERLVRACLQRDADLRWQSMQDALLELGWAGEAEAIRAAAPKRSRVWGVVAGLGALALAAVLVFALRSRPVAASVPTVRFPLAPPGGGEFYASGENRNLAFDPAGRRLAFVATRPGDPRRIWLRSLSGLEATSLAGTEKASSLFWSPDGKSIGFFAGDKLRRVTADGGAPFSICDVRPGIGYMGTWGSDGAILFASVQGEAIYRVSAGGGAATAILKPDPALHQTRVTWPWFLPDGKRFLYQIRSADSGGDPAGSVAVWDSGVRRAIAPLLSDAQYAAPGYLVFTRDGALLAQRFDPAKALLSGEPEPIADSVLYFLSTGWSAFAVSQNGAVAYQSTRDRERLTWFDRQGRALANVGESGGYLSVSIGPDGKRVLFDRSDSKTGTYDVWMFDRERGVETRVTSGPETEIIGVWLPDGQSIIVSEAHGGSPQLFRRNLATGSREPFLPAGNFQNAQSVSFDGRLLAYRERGVGGFVFRTVPLDRSSAPVSRTDPSFNYGSVRFSPKSAHVLFVSNESGSNEAYVAPLESLGAKIRVSSSGATNARWSGDGREVFYLAPDGRFTSVAVQTEPALAVGESSTLFTLKQDEVWTAFDAAPDGKSFLAVVPDANGGKAPMSVVLNWLEQTPR